MTSSKVIGKLWTQVMDLAKQPSPLHNESITSTWFVHYFHEMNHNC
ncbi:MULTISPECIES: hypothetical protein [Clostridium]|nr:MULTISPECIES: hypothetical protein [Clostridium]MCD2500673.1 hypothetical protein [Clostridium sp. NSJ-145]